SAFSRNLLRNGLEMTDHRVLEAGSSEEMMRALTSSSVDLLVGSRELLQGAGTELAGALHRREAGATQVLAVAESEAQAARFDYEAAGYQGCQAKDDAAALFESIAALMAGESPANQLTGARR
ncbi:MAG: hypothetical protein ACLGXA_20110, partial [Acidobacteriota bacterium]